MQISQQYRIFALDNGIPRKGDYVILNITFSATCQMDGKVMVNEKSGEVYFVAPKMKISESSKFCGFVLIYDGMARYCSTTAVGQNSYLSFYTVINCSIYWNQQIMFQLNTLFQSLELASKCGKC